MNLPEYLRFDEREDVINSLEHAAEVLAEIEKRPLNWKWVMVAVHSAFQGALVCTMSGSAGVGALSEKSMKGMLEWFESSRTCPHAPYPDEWLAWPLELYERAKDPRFMGEFGGAPIKTTETQDKDVAQLNEFRRGFVHFAPKSWSIETAGLPRIIESELQVIETVLFSHPANVFRFEPEQRSRVAIALKAIRGCMPSL